MEFFPVFAGVELMKGSLRWLILLQYLQNSGWIDYLYTLGWILSYYLQQYLLIFVLGLL